MSSNLKMGGSRTEVKGVWFSQLPDMSVQILPKSSQQTSWSTWALARASAFTRLWSPVLPPLILPPQLQCRIWHQGKRGDAWQWWNSPQRLHLQPMPISWWVQKAHGPENLRQEHPWHASEFTKVIAYVPHGQSAVWPRSLSPIGSTPETE